MFNWLPTFLFSLFSPIHQTRTFLISTFSPIYHHGDFPPVKCFCCSMRWALTLCVAVSWPKLPSILFAFHPPPFWALALQAYRLRPAQLLTASITKNLACAVWPGHFQSLPRTTSCQVHLLSYIICLSQGSSPSFCEHGRSVRFTSRPRV